MQDLEIKGFQLESVEQVKADSRHECSFNA